MCPVLDWFGAGGSRLGGWSCFLFIANEEWPIFLPGTVGLLLDIRYLIIFDRMLVSEFYIVMGLKRE